MCPLIARVRLRLAEGGFGHFDSCFANLYRSGQDSLGWHADDEDWVGPVIASVSFGATRRFNMKPKPGRPGQLVSFELEHGDLIIMKEGVQEGWLHSVPKTAKPKGPRVNLSFRSTVTP
jgi:alkylated DNA repair dioxygenase AlkB